MIRELRIRALKHFGYVTSAAENYQIMYTADSGVRRRIPFPSLFRTNKDGKGKEGKRIDPGLGYGNGTENGLLFKHNGTTERKTGLL